VSGKTLPVGEADDSDCHEDDDDNEQPDEKPDLLLVG
jgi:hypothetical protein